MKNKTKTKKRMRTKEEGWRDDRSNHVCFLSSTVQQIRNEMNDFFSLVTIRSLSRCLCINRLISIGHLLSTKDRRICLFFACHLSSLSSTPVYRERRRHVCSTYRPFFSLHHLILLALFLRLFSFFFELE